MRCAVCFFRPPGAPRRRGQRHVATDHGGGGSPSRRCTLGARRREYKCSFEIPLVVRIDADTRESRAVRRQMQKHV